MSYRFSLLIAGFIAVWSYFVVVPRYPALAARIGPWTAQSHAAVKRVASAKREVVPGNPGVLQVTLQQTAVDRIDIKTTPLREDTVQRTRAMWGDVMTVSAPPDAPSGAIDNKSGLLIRVPLAGDGDAPASGQPAKISALTLPPGAAASNGGVMAKAMGGSVDKDGKKVAYFLLDNPVDGVRVGQRARVELALAASQGTRKLVPYSAIVYDPKGGAWVFVNLKPLTYLRRPVKIDYIDGDVAVLADGPAVGTPVVLSGAMEIFGAESGVGH
jgi:hypothetical protein